MLRDTVKEGYAKFGNWADLGEEVGVSKETLRKFAHGSDIGDSARIKVEVWAKRATEATDAPHQRLADWLEWMAILARRGLLPGLDLEAIRQSEGESASQAGKLRELANALDRLGTENVANSGSD